MPKQRRSSAETREHVLDVADGLFSHQGIHATGVDQVASTAAVAPTTLYRLFGSKDDLIEAYVARVDDRSRVWFDAATAAAGDDARAQMIAVVAGLCDQVVQTEYQGCGCIKAVAEYPQADDGVHQRAAGAKSWVRQRFVELASAFVAQSGRRIDPAALADELTLVFEGVHATAMTLGGRGPAQRAAQLAERIIDTAPEAAAGVLLDPARGGASRR
jgi:AcrR family transcriptional regulator